MNNLQIFKNDELGQIRAIEKDGQPWFVASDICKVLDIQNATQALYRLDDDERSMFNIGRQGEANIVNEYGLYNLILASRKPEAKKFKRWVTHEVLPSIRKNGGYIANQESLTPEQIVAQALIVANNIIQEKDKLLADMQPKAEYFDELVDRNLLTNFRDTAKELKISQKAFISFLLDKKYIYRDQKGKLMPYAEKNNGLFEVKEYASKRSSHAGLQTLITPKGRETFRLLLQRGIGGK